MKNPRVEFDEKEIGKYELTVEVGDPDSEYGLTRMTLDGSGKLSAEHQAGGREKQRAQKPASFQDALQYDQLLILMKLTSQFNWGRKFPSRPGIPDEAVVSWSFGPKSGGKFNLRVWLRESEQDAAMGPVLKVLRENLNRMSKGRLFL